MATTSITIRPIRLNDVPGYWAALDCVAQERRYITFTEAPGMPNSAYFVTSNIQKGNPHWIAEAEGTVVGWCDVCRQQSFFSHVGTLGIGLTAGYRNQGFGKQLMSAAIEDAWSKDFERIELEVYANNTVAVALYEKFGFVLEGTRRGAARPPAGLIDVHIMGLLSPQRT